MWGWVEREAEGGVANGTLCFGLQAVLNSKPSGETISLIATLIEIRPDNIMSQLEKLMKCQHFPGIFREDEREREGEREHMRG